MLLWQAFSFTGTFKSCFSLPAIPLDAKNERGWFEGLSGSIESCDCCKHGLMATESRDQVSLELEGACCLPMSDRVDGCSPVYRPLWISSVSNIARFHPAGPGKSIKRAFRIFSRNFELPPDFSTTGISTTSRNPASFKASPSPREVTSPKLCW
jgi:hypothetical protein